MGSPVGFTSSITGQGLQGQHCMHSGCCKGQQQLFKDRIWICMCNRSDGVELATQCRSTQTGHGDHFLVILWL